MNAIQLQSQTISTSTSSSVIAPPLFTELRCPVRGGNLAVLLGAEDRIRSVRWEESAQPGVELKTRGLDWLFKALQRFFVDGTPLGGVPWAFLDQTNWTEFQGAVYRAIAEIPHGETRTYGWVAARVGNPAAGRAVGQALRCNPVPILIPCHRVTAVASVGGFMGVIDPGCSEILLKQRLISLEEGFVNPIFDFLT